MPPDFTAPPAVIPAILAAGRAVQVEHQLQVVLTGLIEREIQEIGRSHKGLWRFERPITNREANGVEAAVFNPAKIFSSDKCLPMFLEARFGLIAQRERLAVLVGRVTASIYIGDHPFLKDEPAAEGLRRAERMRHRVGPRL